MQHKNGNVTIRDLYSSLERPEETDGWLVAIHVASFLLAAATLVMAGYAIGTGGALASACLMAVVGPGIAFFMTWALLSRAARTLPETKSGGADDSEAQFRDLLKRR